MFFVKKYSQNCHYLEMIQVQFLTDQHFLVFEIENLKRHIRKPPTPQTSK